MAAVSLKVAAATDSPHVLKQSRKAATPERRRKGLLLTALLGMVLVYFAPSLVAITPLRNVPLRMVFEGIDGRIQSGGASLGWFSPVEYREVEVYDREGSLLLRVPAVTMDRTVTQLLFDRSRLGKVTLEQPEMNLVTRNRGSNAEDVLLPWWNTPSSGPIELALEIVDGTIKLHDTPTRKEWSIASLAVSLQLSLENAAPTSWSAKGKINGGGSSGLFGATSAPDSGGAIELKSEQVPLAMFEWLARRAYENLNLTGDLACELVWQPAGERQTLRGQFGVTKLSLSGGPLQSDSLALADLMLTGDLQLDGQRAQVKELIVDCELGRASAQGEFATAVPRDRQALEAFLHEKFTLQGTLDLARLSQMLPNTLRVRKDTQINDGTVRLRLSSEPSSGEHHWQAQLETSGLAATSAGRPVKWEKPITIELAARESQAGVTVDSLVGSSDFMQLTGKGTPADLSADLAFDLDRLKASVGQLFDLGETRLAGEGRAQLHWQRDDNGAFRATAAAHLKNFQLGADATAVWREEDLTAELTAAGQMTASAVDRLDRAVVRVIAAGSGGASDQLELHLREPVATRGKADAIDRLPMLVHLSGNVNQWRSRLAPWRSWNLAGTIDAHANATWTPAMYELHSLQGSVRQLQATNGTWFIDEPEAQFTAAGRYDAATQRVELVKTAIESSTASIKCDKASIAFSPTGSVSVLGQVDIVAEMHKLQRWTHDPKHPAAIAWSGQLRGRTDLAFGGDRTSFQLDAIIDNLAAHSATAAPGNRGSPNPLRGSPAGATANRPALWQEKQLSLAGKASYSQSSDGVHLENLQIASDALTFQAAGEIQALADKADLNVTGQMDCDWSRLSKLLAPYLGDSVRIEGREKREFAVRGSIRALMDGSATSPAALAAGQQADPFIWIGPLTAKASIGWQRAEAYGLRIGPGEIVGNLRDGLVKIDPIELAVSEGRVRLSPQVLLTPAPAELIHGQAKLIDRVQVTPQMTATWLKYIAPAVADATETRGELSLDLTGAKVPLFNSATASAVGRLDLHTLEVTPGPPARAVLLLAEQIRALAERRPPPAELSRNTTLLRISDQQIDFRMAGGRVVHQGMTMNIGDVTIRTSGWVAFDETIGLVAEIPIKAEWVQGTPALASMKGQALQIPIGGTLRRPQIDPRAWQQVLALFAQNAARGLIEEQLNKQLDRLFQPR